MSHCVAVANVFRNGPPLEAPGYLADTYPFGSFDSTDLSGKLNLDVIPAIHARITEWNVTITASIDEPIGINRGTGTIDKEDALLSTEFHTFYDGNFSTLGASERNLGLPGSFVTPVPTNTDGLGTSDYLGSPGVFSAVVGMGFSTYLGSPLKHSRDGNIWWPQITFTATLSSSPLTLFFTTNRGTDFTSYVSVGTLTIRIPDAHAGGAGTQDLGCPLYLLASDPADTNTTCDIVLTPKTCFPYSGVWNNAGEALVNPITLT